MTNKPQKPATKKPAKADLPKRKPGGQPGNRSPFRHGLTGTGKLPRKLAYIECRLNNFRRLLEDAVIADRGRDPDVTEASIINTALKWERHGALAQRWITVSYDELKPDQLINFSREVARASAERDKSIKQLNLSQEGTQNVLTVLYGKEESA